LDAGLDCLFRDLNGFRELYVRKDVEKFLIKRYMEKIQSLNFLNEEFSLRFVYSVSNIEALLTRIERQESLKEILRNLVIGYEAFFTVNDDYCRSTLFTRNYVCRANMIIKMCEPCLEEIPNGMDNSIFYPRTMYISYETRDIINKFSYQLIK